MSGRRFAASSSRSTLLLTTGRRASHHADRNDHPGKFARYTARISIAVCLALAACSPTSTQVGPPSPSTLTTITAQPPVTTTPTVASTIVPTSTTLAATTTGEPDASVTSGEIEIVGETFLIGGTIANQGSRAEGLLMNSRMVQAFIDIEGDSSIFAYPDTGVWDAERNTTEFIAALPDYASHGLNAITVSLQGGNPLDAPVQNRPAWRISAYGPEGDLDPAWMDRLDRVLRAADAEGMAVIVGLFYFGQDHHLNNEAAVVNAVDNVVDWLIERDHRNVLVEVCNECNVHYDHEILQPDRVAELIARVTERSNGRLPVSVSLSGGRLPNDRIIAASNFVLLHGNRQDDERVAGMVRQIRKRPAFIDDPKPILFNEDSTSLENLRAAVDEGAGWGYYDKGANDYRNGFQAPPVDWSISTDEKRRFFEEVARLTSP